MEIPKHYSLHSEEDGHFVVHDGRDNKTFQVSKKALHPATQIKIMKMQKFASGGSVLDDLPEGHEEEAIAQQETGEPGEEPTLPLPEPAVNDQISQPMQTSFGPSATDEVAALSNAQMNAPQSQPIAQGAVPTSGLPKGYPTSSEVMGLANQQQRAVQQEATAQQKQNDAMVAQYEKNLAAEQKMFEDHQQKMQQYDQQYNQMAADVAASKIDPEKYWNDKSTGSKIAAVVGLMLGGIGAGLTHGPNMGLETLNKHIENDIEAQKSTLGKKMTLLSENLRHQGTMMAAQNATRLQMAAMAQGQLLKVAAQTNNPIIAARAQMQAAQIQQATIPMRAQLAQNELMMGMRADVMRKLKSGQSGDLDLFDMARAGMVDKGTAEKESAAMSKRQQAEAFAIDQLTKYNNEKNITSPQFPYLNPINPNSHERVKSLKAGIIQAIQNASPSKRLSDEMLGQEIEPFLSGYLTTDHNKAENMKSIIGIIRSHADPTPVADKWRLRGSNDPRNVIPKDFKLGPVK